MFKYRYDQKSHALQILKNGFQSKYMGYELKVLALYYKSEGIKPKERKELLIKFCEQHVENFNLVKYYKVINRAWNHSRKKNNILITIDKIVVKKNEINYIENSNVCYECKKIMFSLLVKQKIKEMIYNMTNQKISSNYYFNSSRVSDKELKNTSVLIKSADIDDLFNQLHNTGLVEIRDQGNIKLNFLYEIYELEDSDIATTVYSFHNIGHYLDFYLGVKQIIKCNGKSCNVVIKQTSNRKKYCDDCWRDKEREIKREWKRNYDKKSRSLENDINPIYNKEI